MMPTIDALGLKDQDDSFLQLGALFDGEFSIDWIQTLSGAKATRIMKVFDRFKQSGILETRDVGSFSFVDARKRQELHRTIPVETRKKIHRLIAELLRQ